MELHRKDFLLFTCTDAARKNGTGGILEMHISNDLPGAAWQGHWQEARPAIAHFVREKKQARRAFYIAYAEDGHSTNSNLHQRQKKKQRNQRRGMRNKGKWERWLSQLKHTSQSDIIHTLNFS
jgi:hypothetical protein